MRHPLVHAADDHRQCGVGPEREVAECAQAEGEGNWNSAEHSRGHDAYEEDQQVEPTQVLEQAVAKRKSADQG